MSSLRRFEGYLLIDHRNSPGIPSDLAPLLYNPIDIMSLAMLGGGKVFEAPTITCSHCQQVVMVNRMRTRPRGYCAKCDHYICDNPTCHIECRPIKKLIDQLSEQANHNLITI